MRRNAGFSLAELLVSVAILGIVALYLTDMMVRQSRTYTVVDQVTEAQQNLRAISDLLERDLRQAGFMVPEGAAICGVDNTLGADVLVVSDADAIDQPNAAPIQIAYAADFPNGDHSGTGIDTLNVDSLTMNGNATYDTNNDGVGDSDFMFSAALGQAGGVIVMDRENPNRGTSCGIITAVNIPGVSVTVDFTLGGAAPGGTPLAVGVVGTLVAIPAHVYQIVSPVPGQFQLSRNGMVLADDIEDLQWAAFYDLGDGAGGDPDGLVNNATTGQPPWFSATEYPGSLPGLLYTSGGFDNRALREVRVNFVARTRNPDPDVMVNAGVANAVFQVTENRIAPVGGPDGFRRRVQTVTVRSRNVGDRPVSEWP